MTPAKKFIISPINFTVCVPCDKKCYCFLAFAHKSSSFYWLFAHESSSFISLFAKKSYSLCWLIARKSYSHWHVAKTFPVHLSDIQIVQDWQGYWWYSYRSRMSSRWRTCWTSPVEWFSQSPPRLDGLLGCWSPASCNRTACAHVQTRTPDVRSRLAQGSSLIWG